MPLKRYGIFIAYPPKVSLFKEGLGRYLANFLKGAACLPGVRFTVVCPSWSIESLMQLFESENVPLDAVEILTPNGKPYSLQGYDIWNERKRKKGMSRKSKMLSMLVNFHKSTNSQLRQTFIDAIVSRHPTTFAIKSLVALLHFSIVGLLVLLPLFVSRKIAMLTKSVKIKIDIFHRVVAILKQPKDSILAVNLYKELYKSETKCMIQIINDLDNIIAWYCPTAFWSEFKNIKAPRLQCVPDVVLKDFSVGFSQICDDRMENTFEQVEKSIRFGSYFVTYSTTVKWQTLVDHYAIPSKNISVVRHAPEDLSTRINLIGVSDTDAGSVMFCQDILDRALMRSTCPNYTNAKMEFLFYASQFRPNKNIITLLRAYEYLLRKCFIGHKMVLTGHLASSASINAFINKNRLNRDVICIHSLSTTELAACYKLADLAINPSLSEGGCPFTFDEALSVNTPVVMAKIDVTMEEFGAYDKHDEMFFDPYDWRDMSYRIRWALENKQYLLESQQHIYQERKRRSWKDVSLEHIRILDKISSSKEPRDFQ